MAGKNFSATADLEIIDSGKGVLFTLTPTKGGVNTTLPSGTPAAVPASSDPALSLAADPGDPNATPPRPADTTNLVFLGSIAQPPKDVAGIVATFNYTFPDGNTLVATAPAVDIVAPVNNDPDGFTIQEAAV